MGLEPTTLCLGSRCSSTELRPLLRPLARERRVNYTLARRVPAVDTRRTARPESGLFWVVSLMRGAYPRPYAGVMRGNDRIRAERTPGLVKWLVIRHEGREIGKILLTEENERHFHERFLLRLAEIDDLGSRYYELLGKRHDRSRSAAGRSRRPSLAQKAG
jgi:hypothetical protein